MFLKSEEPTDIILFNFIVAVAIALLAMTFLVMAVITITTPLFGFFMSLSTFMLVVAMLILPALCILQFVCNYDPVLGLRRKVNEKMGWL